MVYIISEDIQILMKRWAEGYGFSLPSDSIFHCLRQEMLAFLNQMFSAVEMVAEQELTKGIRKLVFESGIKPVSLDQVYTSCDHNLSLTRCVDKNGENIGLRHRPGSTTFLAQIRELAGLREVALVDDVIFSGVLIERVIKILSLYDIAVPLVITGVGIAEGIDRINHTREIQYVHRYESVIDEICERDFYPGVPYSGRPVVGTNTGMPYLLPFGKPGEWASIPHQWKAPFSRFCIQQTIKLFEQIEKSSNRIVRCSDLERGVYTLPQDGTRFVDALHQSMQRL